MKLIIKIAFTGLKVRKNGTTVNTLDNSKSNFRLKIWETK
jgi:hypothetical protein